MGAIAGIVGAGTLIEVHAMVARMPHRGAQTHAWSPAPGVYFACRGARGANDPETICADAVLDDQTLETLSAGLERGVQSLRTVHGYFSLAFWDERRQDVVLACDTSGYKSLYYVRLPDRLAFASEYKALLALSDVRAELDRAAAQYYVAARSFRMDRPLLAGVQSITAGSALFARTDEAPHRYWSAVRNIAQRPPAAFARDVRQTLERVVERQAQRFSRVGITLSAGLDSACVLALLRAVRPDIDIASYTIGHGPDDPEAVGGRELAAAFGTQHHELVFDPASVPADLTRLVWLMEDCAGREESLLQHAVLREASRRESVVFGGYGADVLFAGMPRYRLLLLRERLPMFRSALSELYRYTQVGTIPRSWLGKVARRVASAGEPWPPPAIIGAPGPAVADVQPLETFIASQMTEAQDSSYIEPTLESGGVEFRDPFQSTEMMELALKIPGNYNVSWRRQKMVLRAAVADLLPRSFRRRPKSLQRVRHDALISDVLDAMADELLSPEQLRKRRIVDQSYVSRLRSRRGGQAYSSERLYRLWTLVSLELWMRHFVDHRGQLVTAPVLREEQIDMAAPQAALTAR